MIEVALKGLAGRKLRALLTAFAVVIGVSMVSGTYVLTDTIKQAFDGIFSQSYADTDAVINGSQLVDFSAGGRPPCPPRCWPRSGAAGRRGRLGQPDGPPEQLQRGQAARRRRQDHRPPGQHARRRRRPVRPALQAAQAQAGRVAERGRTRSCSTPGPPPSRSSRSATGSRSPPAGPAAPYTITGLARFGTVDSLGGATIAVFDLQTAQALFEKAGPSTASRSPPSPASRPRRWPRRSSRCSAPTPWSRPATRRPRRTPRTPTAG